MFYSKKRWLALYENCNSQTSSLIHQCVSQIFKSSIHQCVLIKQVKSFPTNQLIWNQSRKQFRLMSCRRCILNFIVSSRVAVSPSSPINTHSPQFSHTHPAIFSFLLFLMFYSKLTVRQENPDHCGTSMNHAQFLCDVHH